MAKRNPIAGALAHPGFRQRVSPDKRKAIRAKITEAFSASLAYLADDDDHHPRR